MPIQAENFYSATAAEKRQNGKNGFEMRGLDASSSLVYPNVMNLPQNCEATFRVWSENPGGGVIEVWRDDDDSQLLGSCEVPGTRGQYTTVRCSLKNNEEKQNIRLAFKGKGKEMLSLDWMRFSE